MKKINKGEKDDMIAMGIIKAEKGVYKEMYVANRKHKSRAKSYYVEDSIYKNYLRRTKKNNFVKG
jgi:hypothetical protein